ncbi:MAG TPA: sensor histidine kinase [Pseudolabrys sp.]|nr:sensor histidine kinase [Pseudolabrys sp.]
MSGSPVKSSDSRHANAQPTMSVRELAHRINNMLAVVQAIINQTARTTGDPALFVTAVNARIAAMAAANRSLLTSEWDGADLESLVRQELLTQGAADTRLRLSGPRTALPPRDVVAFALVIHELATNAVKFGALSGMSGIVELDWSVAANGEGRDLLSVIWRESGGPPVTAPTHKGFGSLLLERGIDDCKVERSFTAEGLICRIALPL